MSSDRGVCFTRSSQLFNSSSVFFCEGDYILELPVNLIAAFRAGHKCVEHCDVSVKTFVCGFC